MRNLRGLGHLQHDGGLRVGQVVRRVNAGVDGIQRPQAAAGGGQEGLQAVQQLFVQPFFTCQHTINKYLNFNQIDESVENAKGVTA